MTRVINIRTLSPNERDLVVADRLPGYKYIGRVPGRIGYWSNRYSHKHSNVPGVIQVESRREAVRRHRLDVLARPEMIERIKRELRGLTLVCWCKPEVCHGDTYVEIADEDERFPLLVGNL